MKFKDLLSGFVRLHVLHHAAEHEIYGQWMIDELARHGYDLSPGTLYPMLHAMEQRGYLRSRKERAGRTIRTLYRATALGRRALALAKVAGTTVRVFLMAKGRRGRGLRLAHGHHGRIPFALEPPDREEDRPRPRGVRTVLVRRPDQG